MEGIPQLTIARVRFLRSFLQQGRLCSWKSGKGWPARVLLPFFSINAACHAWSMSLWIHVRTHVIAHLKEWASSHRGNSDNLSTLPAREDAVQGVTL